MSGFCLLNAPPMIVCWCCCRELCLAWCIVIVFYILMNYMKRSASNELLMHKICMSLVSPVIIGIFPCPIGFPLLL